MRCVGRSRRRRCTSAGHCLGAAAACGESESRRARWVRRTVARRSPGDAASFPSTRRPPRVGSPRRRSRHWRARVRRRWRHDDRTRRRTKCPHPSTDRRRPHHRRAATCGAAMRTPLPYQRMGNDCTGTGGCTHRRQLRAQQSHQQRPGPLRLDAVHTDIDVRRVRDQARKRPEVTAQPVAYATRS